MNKKVAYSFFSLSLRKVISKLKNEQQNSFHCRNTFRRDFQ